MVVWEASGSDPHRAMKWLVEHNLPRTKLDGQALKILFNLHNNNNIQIYDQKAEGDS